MANLDDATTHFIDSELINNPLQTRPQLVVTVAGLFEHAQCGFDGGQEVFA